MTAESESHASLTEEQLAHAVNGAAGVEYWQKVSSDINGMLGGFPAVSRIDLQGSRTFLARFGIGTKRDRKSIGTVLDAGAGYVVSFSFDLQLLWRVS